MIVFSGAAGYNGVNAVSGVCGEKQLKRLKLFRYRTAGVREYWIVDPAKGRVIVYRFEKQTM